MFRFLERTNEFETSLQLEKQDFYFFSQVITTTNLFIYNILRG